MDFEKLIEKRNNEEGFSKLLEIKTTKIEEGKAEAKIEIKPEHYNDQGILHGGLLFSLADTVGGAAARSYGYDVVTVNANIDYIEGGANVETLYAYAREIKHGNKISRYEVELYDHLKHLLAVGTFTYYSRGSKLSI